MDGVQQKRKETQTTQFVALVATPSWLNSTISKHAERTGPAGEEADDDSEASSVLPSDLATKVSSRADEISFIRRRYPRVQRAC